MPFETALYKRKEARTDIYPRVGPFRLSFLKRSFQHDAAPVGLGPRLPLDARLPMSGLVRRFQGGERNTSIFPHLAQLGGIRPAARKRPRFVLRLAERQEISRRLVSERSLRPIAQSLNRSPSTISGEVHRNGRRQACRAARSDQRV